MTDERLRLIALDSDDLKIISSCCQDGILQVGRIEYKQSAGQFIVPLNRFVWEKETSQPAERRGAVLHFNHVKRVKVMGVDRKQPDTVLSLLAVLFEEETAPSGEIELVFAGDGAIRLEVECIDAQLTDMLSAWDPHSRPSHEAD